MLTYRILVGSRVHASRKPSLLFPLQYLIDMPNCRKKRKTRFHTVRAFLFFSPVLVVPTQCIFPVFFEVQKWRVSVAHFAVPRPVVRLGARSLEALRQYIEENTDQISAEMM